MKSPYRNIAAPLRKAEEKARSPGEEMLALHIRAAKLPPPMREYVFAPGRKWRADFAYPHRRLLIEVDGGNTLATICKDGSARAVGRHTTAKDYDKLNEGALLGWRVLRFTPAMIKSGLALATIERALA